MKNLKVKTGRMFPVTVQVSAERICDLLVSALEGGSNYWIDSVDVGSKETNAGAEVMRRELGISSKYTPGWAMRPLLNIGRMTITINEPIGPENDILTYRLDLAAIKKGLGVMANLKPGKGGHHWGAFCNEDDDAETADVFLQCCLFGEIVFG